MSEYPRRSIVSSSNGRRDEGIYLYSIRYTIKSGLRMTTELFRIAGDTATVTGSSTGIGHAIAERFAAGGVGVVSSRDQERVDSVANDINSSDRPGRARHVTSGIGRPLRRSLKRQRPSLAQSMYL